MLYGYTKFSGNTKLGPIPVVTSSKLTCPSTCPLKENGCYADYGPLAWHWDKITKGTRGITYDELRSELKHLPRGQYWRYGQAGDLPGKGNTLNVREIKSLAKSAKHCHGLSYTHKQTSRSIKVYHELKQYNFTVNLSATTLEKADELVAHGLPVVTTLPIDYPKDTLTPAGNRVVTCPNSFNKKIQCVNCQMCWGERDYIVGFPAHGARKKNVERVFFKEKA